jgi:hypothetical protein
MPKTIFLGNESNGMSVTWTPSAQRVDIDGWYDGICAIDGGSFKLSEFFRELGITKKDIRKALKEVASDA